MTPLPKSSPPSSVTCTEVPTSPCSPGVRSKGGEFDDCPVILGTTTSGIAPDMMEKWTRIGDSGVCFGWFCKVSHVAYLLKRDIDIINHGSGRDELTIQ